LAAVHAISKSWPKTWWIYQFWAGLPHLTTLLDFGGNNTVVFDLFTNSSYRFQRLTDHFPFRTSHMENTTSQAKLLHAPGTFLRKQWKAQPAARHR
jgi:hypothetical protein